MRILTPTCSLGDGQNLAYADSDGNFRFQPQMKAIAFHKGFFPHPVSRPADRVFPLFLFKSGKTDAKWYSALLPRAHGL